MNQDTLNRLYQEPRQIKLNGAGARFPAVPAAPTAVPAWAPDLITGPGGILDASGDPVSSSVLPQELELVHTRWRGRPKVRTDAELEKVMPPVLLDGLLRKSELLMLSGAAKSRKSFVAMELLVRNELAGLYPDTPQHWMGRRIVPTHLVYINFELTEVQFEKRLRKMFNSMDPTGKHWGKTLDLWYTSELHLKGISMSPELLCAYLTKLRVPSKLTGEVICPEDPGVIIIDPMYCVSSAENEIGEVVSFLQKIQSVALDMNAAIICLHHFAKGNSALKEQIDRHSGSGGYARFFDVLACITAMEIPDHMEFQATIRDDAPLMPTSWRWQYPFYIRAEEADGLALRGEKGKSQVADEMYVSVLKENQGEGDGLGKKEWGKLVAEKWGVTPRTASDRIPRIVEDEQHHIEEKKVGAAKYFRISASPYPDL